MRKPAKCSFSARWLIKRREITGTARTRYGTCVTYGPWQTVVSYATPESALDGLRAQTVGLYERAIFYRNKRMTTKDGIWTLDAFRMVQQSREQREREPVEVEVGCTCSTTALKIS